jgi:FkbM family methyltransferase
MAASKSIRSWLREADRYLRAKRVGLLALLLRRIRPWNISIVRKARFQASIGEQDFLLAYRQGEYFLVFTNDNVVSKGVYASSRGGFDFQKFERAVKLLGAGFQLDTLIDVGANIGTICIPAVRRGYARRAIAIEPEPRNYRLLVANILLNDLGAAIEPYQTALGAPDSKFLKLGLAPDNSATHRVSAASGCDPATVTQNEIVVPSTTLDDIAPLLTRDGALIWIDAEGYEGIILSGARAAVASRVPLVIEFTPHFMRMLDSYAPLKQAMLNYTCYYDLAEPAPRSVPISEAALDALWQRFSGPEFQTDLLLV